MDEVRIKDLASASGVGGVRRVRVHRRRPDCRRIDEGFR